jgi:hypothetical protein
MKLSHSVTFQFGLILPQAAATDFVRDVKTSLKKATFIHDLELNPHEAIVSARLPVNAALFGQQTLAFKSRLINSSKGARLEALPIETSEPGWAEVSGEALVSPAPAGSLVEYRFDIAIHLKLPAAEKWGGKALSKMIEFTAQRVLENISSSFPSAVQEAAKEVEAHYIR